MAQRSPNYPAASLEEAVAWLKLFFTAARRTAIDGATAARAIGFKTLNGRTRMQLSAMKKYGLLNEGPNGTLSITDLGVRIVHPSPDGLDAALREAALTPEIFRAVHGTHLDSSPDVLTSYLIREKDFTPDGAVMFGKFFRDTVKFAKLDDPAYLAIETPAAAPKVETMENTVARTAARPHAAVMPTAAPPNGGLFFSYKGKEITLQVSVDGERLNSGAIAKVRKYLELAEEDLGEAGDS